MKIGHKTYSPLNESAVSFANSNLKEAVDKIKYYIGYTTEDGDDKVFKTLKDANKLRPLVKDFMQNPDKLDSLGAVALYVNSVGDDEEIFVALKDEDTDNWEIELDNFDEFSSKSVPDEYKDILFNQVYYSLTGTFPDNFKSTSPELASKVMRTNKGNYVKEGDEIGVMWEDNGDAIIKINIDRVDEDDSRVKAWIKEVADKFGVDLRDKGKGRYDITVKDQAKFFTDVKED